MTLAGLADGRYYTEAVQWSVDWGVAGIDGNCFRPDEPVSRGEAAVYIWNTEGQPSAPDHRFVHVTDEHQAGLGARGGEHFLAELVHFLEQCGAVVLRRSRGPSGTLPEHGQSAVHPLGGGYRCR